MICNGNKKNIESVKLIIISPWLEDKKSIEENNLKVKMILIVSREYVCIFWHAAKPSRV